MFFGHAVFQNGGLSVVLNPTLITCGCLLISTHPSLSHPFLAKMLNLWLQQETSETLADVRGISLHFVYGL